jgi:hypothetical protein
MRTPFATIGVERRRCFEYKESHSFIERYKGPSVVVFLRVAQPRYRPSLRITWQKLRGRQGRLTKYLGL